MDPNKNEVVAVFKWFKSKTVWCAIGIGVVRTLEKAGAIAPGIADLLETIFGVGGVIGARHAIAKIGAK